MTKEFKNGFTLVELAIVLMIIGLLIGGILRGKELMENAQVTNTIQQINAYKGALATFHSSYNALPGDLIFATQRIPGCTVANSCKNGNGDNMIGGTMPPWQSITNDVISENTQFWKQMALVHLITGIDPSASTAAWGRTHPVSKMGPGFFARNGVYNGAVGQITMSGLVLLLRRDITGDWVCDTGGKQTTCSMSGLRAAQLDNKMDDGVAVTGDVLAVSQGWSNGCGTANLLLNGPKGYAETSSDTTCDMMFIMK